jgi:hypothetical protein
MSVYHVLKDGSKPTDITGHIVRTEDAYPLYQFLHSINRTRTGKARSFKNEVRVCLRKS